MVPTLAISEAEGEGPDFGESARAHLQDLAAVVRTSVWIRRVIIWPAEDEHAAVETHRAGQFHNRPSFVRELRNFPEGT